MPMPPDVKEIWDFLWQEVSGVHTLWRMFTQLFLKSPNRGRVLDETAPIFFNFVQGTLLDKVQLTLSKLGDPAETRGSKNATLDTLLQAVLSLNVPGLGTELEELLRKYRDSCMQIKRRRNKQLAHYDWHALLGPKLNPIEEPTRVEIDTALNALAAFMNAVDKHFAKNTTAFRVPVISGGPDSLIAFLAQGMRYQQLLREHKIPWDDFSKSDYYQV